MILYLKIDLSVVVLPDNLETGDGSDRVLQNFLHFHVSYNVMGCSEILLYDPERMRRVGKFDMKHSIKY